MLSVFDSGMRLKNMKTMKFKALSTAILLSFALSCSQNEKIDFQSEQKEFLFSVAIVETNSVVTAKVGDKSKVAQTIEVFNLNKKLALHDAYKVNDIEYSDNGQFNDLVAGDNIYTSVETFALSEIAKEFDIKVSKSQEFKYSNQLTEILQERYPKNARTKSIGVSCQISLRTCPQTSWYNTCWWGDSCTCVHIGPCSAEFSIF
jgi:hypothetical protein